MLVKYVTFFPSPIACDQIVGVESVLILAAVPSTAEESNLIPGYPTCPYFSKPVRMIAVLIGFSSNIDQPVFIVNKLISLEVKSS